MPQKPKKNIIYRAEDWFEHRKWTPFAFQQETWQAYLDGYSGLVNAPTGSGKTYSVFLGAALKFIEDHPDTYQQEGHGLQLIWIAPIRALTKEIKIACQRACEGLGLNWNIAIRSGDTTTTDRKKQLIKPPEVLITTPESLHVLLATKKYPSFFKRLQAVVVDEWHELMGSKRGVQTELLICRLRGLHPQMRVWGISATIGNMDEAVDVLLGYVKPDKWKVIKADIQKEITVETIIPDEIEKFPWAGHLGIKLLKQVVPYIHKSKTSLIFTNTRAQCEIWYQNLLEEDPDLAGLMAMHHGSISKEIREWVEEALYEGKLKAVVCTSSLDLGVDFRPVETIIQIGSPKGVSRFVQRAGRSGHRPGAESKIIFVPTNSLELIEAAALKKAIKTQHLENRIPYIRSFDVLIQYLMTLAVSEGFVPDQIYDEIKKTYSYFSITEEEWQAVLNHLVHGSDSLKAYDEFQKIIVDQGVYKVEDRKIAQRHRMSIGTIVSDTMIHVRFTKGTHLGSVEEYFAAQLNPGDTFWFAGRMLEVVRLKEMILQVRLSKKKTGKTPAYMGSRMSLSSEMSEDLRAKIYDFKNGILDDPEMEVLMPLFEIQQERSYIPDEDEFLIEYFQSKEGYHMMFYPLEGRQVHEGMGALVAQRLSAILPITFSIAMNDYGFELLSDQKLDIKKLVNKELFSTEKLSIDIQASLNAVEMAKRRFRDIARISGLIFAGYPGRQKKDRHLQASAQLLFEVFREYEPENLLFQQTFDEVMTFQLEEARLRVALERIQSQKFMLVELEKVSPFSFPIMVDGMSRNRLSSETLADRIERMKVEDIRRV